MGFVVVIAAHPGLRQQQGPRADMESAPTVQGSMLVIDPEMYANDGGVVIAY